jgi:hypothetical protein
MLISARRLLRKLDCPKESRSEGILLQNQSKRGVVSKDQSLDVFGLVGVGRLIGQHWIAREDVVDVEMELCID